LCFLVAGDLTSASNICKGLVLIQVKRHIGITIVVMILLNMFIGNSALSGMPEKELHSEQVWNLFQKLHKESRKMASLQVRVAKVTEDPFLIEGSTESRGILRYQRPKNYFQEITEPAEYKTVLVLYEDSLKVYYPSAKPHPFMEVIRIKNKSRGSNEANKLSKAGHIAQIFKDLSFQLRELEWRYEVSVFAETLSAGTVTDDRKARVRYRIELIPKKKEEDLRKLFSRLVIWTDGKQPWPMKLSYVDASDDFVVTYHFSEIQVNIEFDEESFIIEVAPNTEVIYLN